MNKTTSSFSASGRFTSIAGLQNHLGTGRYTAREVARSAKAEARIGRRVLYDLQKIDAYMEKVALAAADHGKD